MIRKILRKNDGITLVELMVSIAIGTMIFAAATTVLLLGFRIHAKTTDSIEQQYTARMVISMLEQMAENGEFDKVDRQSDGSWKLGKKDASQKNKFASVTLSYSAPQKTIYTGDYGTESKTAVLENVIASYIILEGKLLTISLEDANSTYTSTVYCRTTQIEGGKNFEAGDNTAIIPKPGESDAAEKQGRAVLLNFLNSQAGVHGGIINHDKRTCGSICGNRCHQFNFFSQWYVNGYENNPGWSAETPWCGCFVSWGLCHVDGLTKQGPNDRWFANVDDFMDYFTEETTGGWKTSGTTPVPGDLIFFDMVNGSNDNPSHMGVVLSTETPVDDNNAITVIKTIEGNSADMVAIREYTLPDKRILGYGDPWAAQPIPSEKPDAS